MEELRPDELVQEAFQGEIRPNPPGLVANLLPFQVEGFSWMIGQEKKDRGGILGKCFQTCDIYFMNYLIFVCSIITYVKQCYYSSW